MTTSTPMFNTGVWLSNGALNATYNTFAFGFDLTINTLNRQAMIAPNNFTVKGLVIKVNSNAKACAGSYKLVVDGVESNSLTLGAGQTGVISNSFEEAVTEGQEVTTRLLTGNCSGTIKAYYCAVVDWDQGV